MEAARRLFRSLRSPAACAAACVVGLVGPRVASGTPPVRIDCDPTSAGPGLRSLRGSPPVIRDAEVPTILGAARPELHHSRWSVGGGDFAIRATLLLESIEGRGLGLTFDGGRLELDQPEAGGVLRGTLFGGGSFTIAESRPPAIRPGAPFELVLAREDGRLMLWLDGIEAGSIGMRDIPLGRLGFSLGGGRLRVLACEIEGDLVELPLPRSVFETPDGDIDEHRDPVLASDGTTVLLGAIAATTRDDGSVLESLRIRRLGNGPAPTAAETADLGGLEPELASLGHDGRRWTLAVQTALERGFSRRVEILASTDGLRFERVATVETPPIRLSSGAASRLASGALAFTATVVEADGPRPALLVADEGDWKVRLLSDEPSGEPTLIGDGRVLVRRAGSLDRSTFALRDAGVEPAAPGDATPPKPVDAIGYRGAPVTPAAIRLGPATWGALQPAPGHPNPLSLLAGDDRGVAWSRVVELWGGPSGAVTAVHRGDERIVLFEGGDATRREHVLLLVLGEEDIERLEARAGTDPSVSEPPRPRP